MKDRLVFGLIAAVAGLFVGVAAAVVLVWERPRHAFHSGLVLFSVLYFFFAGLVLKARAADLLAGAAEAGMHNYEMETTGMPRSREPMQTIASDPLTVAIGVGYVIGALLVVFMT